MPVKTQESKYLGPICWGEKKNQLCCKAWSYGTKYISNSINSFSNKIEFGEENEQELLGDREEMVK